MKTRKKKCSLATLDKGKEKTNTDSKYQRPEVWKRAQKQLLIDSIMRGYDIPKIYVKEEDSNTQYDYEVIDGQQRLTAIWGFFDGDFALPKDAEPINGIKCASQTYRELDKSLQEHFNDYQMDVVVVTEAIQDEDTDEIGELFLRLQNGTPLNAQEKRNAMPGNMRDFVKDLAGIEDKKEGHKFFKSCAINNNRYGYDQLAAKLVLLESSLQETGKSANVTSGDLDKFYEKQNNFDRGGEVAINVKKVLDYLHRAFPDKTPELVQHSVTTLYCIASKLIRHNIADGTEYLLGSWFMQFEEERRENEKKEDDQKDPTLLEYKFCFSSGSEGYKHIEKRLEILENSFYEANPNIERI